MNKELTPKDLLLNTVELVIAGILASGMSYVMDPIHAAIQSDTIRKLVDLSVLLFLLFVFFRARSIFHKWLARKGWL